MPITEKIQVILALILLLSGLYIQYSGLVTGMTVYFILGMLWILGYMLMYRTTVIISNERIYSIVLLASIVYVSVTIIEGTVFGWGLNTIDTRPIGILVNLSRFIPYVLFVESLRSYIAHIVGFKFKKNSSIIPLIAAIFTILYIPLGKLINPPTTTLSLIKLIARTIMPTYALSILLTYLSYIGGSLASTILLVMVNLPQFISPILPATPWFLEGFTNTVLFLLFTLMIVNTRMELTKPLRLRGISKREVMGILAYMLSLTIILSFIATETRPYVIVSGSMEPTISLGDIAIVKKIRNVSQVGLGDIIAFKFGDEVVMHRIVAIEQESNIPVFVTKGDANRDIDPWVVEPDKIIGKVVYVIPKLGIPLIYALMYLNNPFTILGIVVVVLLYTYIPRIKSYRLRRRGSVL